MTKTDNIRLNMLGLPLIQDIDDISKLTHLSKYTIFQLSTHADKYYKTYEIVKKDGKARMISQPCKKLKGLQAWILVNILNPLEVSNSCKGFEQGSSIAKNAEPHVGANTVLTIDLMDFFLTIKSKQIYNIFRAIGYNTTISTILTRLCTFQESLPQGGPCSPKLANLSCWNLDVRIQGYVGRRGINYTRYADDMSFSGLTPTKVIQIFPMIKTIVENERFSLNVSKTRISGSARAKIVTGLTITNDTFGIGKQKYKKLRAKIHHLILPQEQLNTKLLFEITGWLSYLKSVDKKRWQKANKYISYLKIKHPNTLISGVKVNEKIEARVKKGNSDELSF